MALTPTIEEQVATMLQNNWSLLGNVAVGNCHFDTGWFDAKLGRDLKPQITVRHLFSPEPLWFGPSPSHVDLHYISWDKYAVNLWHRFREGQEGVNERREIEQMRDEVFRILNNQRESFPPPIGLVLPLDRGTPLHEFNVTPRLLRYELIIQVNYKS